MHHKSRMIKILEDLGLTTAEANIYFILLKKSGASVNEVAREAGLTRQRIYNILENLSEKGIVYVSSQRPRKYFAISPEIATSVLIRDVERRLYNLIRIREELVNIVKSMGVERTVPFTLSHEVSGRRALIGVVKEFIKKAREELVIGATRNEAIRLIYEYKPEILEIVDRGVRIFLLTSMDQLPHDVKDFLEKIATCSDLTISARIYVRDGEETILMPSEGSLRERRWYDEGIILRNRDISRAIRDMFMNIRVADREV